MFFLKLLNFVLKTIVNQIKIKNGSKIGNWTMLKKINNNWK